MAENSFNGVVESLIKGMDGFLSTKTVIGDATKVGDTIIVPLVDVSFGVGAGSANGKDSNGGMGALSGKVTPSAVLVIHDGHTRLVNIKNQDSMTKILDLIPDIVDRISQKNKPIPVNDEDAAKLAFPESEDEE